MVTRSKIIPCLWFDDRAEEERLLRQSIEKVTELAGKRPVGFRAPSWAFSRHTLGLVLEAGFLYDSSMMALDEPYERLERVARLARTCGLGAAGPLTVSSAGFQPGLAAGVSCRLRLPFPFG